VLSWLAARSTVEVGAGCSTVQTMTTFKGATFSARRCDGGVVISREGIRVACGSRPAVAPAAAPRLRRTRRSGSSPFVETASTGVHRESLQSGSASPAPDESEVQAVGSPYPCSRDVE